MIIQATIGSPACYGMLIISKQLSLIYDNVQVQILFKGKETGIHHQYRLLVFSIKSGGRESPVLGGIMLHQ